MKTLYFDTNYLFRLYSNESGASQVQTLAQKTGTIAIAWHGWAEMAAVLLRKRREASLPPDGIEEIRHQFTEDRIAGLIELLPLSTAVVERLERVLHQAPDSVFLRAADALHLACAAEHGFTEVYSHDRHFLAAAPHFHLRGLDVIDSA